MKAKATNTTIEQYPYTLADLRRDNPNTMFPDDFDAWAVWGCVDVIPSQRPAGDVVTESTPELVNGEWVQQWTARDYTADELAALVPAEVPALSGLLAIDAAGLASAYTAWAASPDRTFAERAFIDKATVWKRNDPVLLAGGEALGLTSQNLDDLFILASQI